jgi:hypothetical protein
MPIVNPFIDNRQIPKIGVNVKVKVKTESSEENAAWNKAFGYIMKKPRTKLEFLTTSSIRKLNLEKITLKTIQNHIGEQDYLVLKEIEDIFNTRLTNDIKSFVLGVLRIPVKTLEEITNN